MEGYAKGFTVKGSCRTAVLVFVYNSMSALWEALNKTYQTAWHMKLPNNHFHAILGILFTAIMSQTYKLPSLVVNMIQATEYSICSEGY